MFSFSLQRALDMVESCSQAADSNGFCWDMMHRTKSMKRVPTVDRTDDSKAMSLQNRPPEKLETQTNQPKMPSPSKSFMFAHFLLQCIEILPFSPSLLWPNLLHPSPFAFLLFPTSYDVAPWNTIKQTNEYVSWPAYIVLKWEKTLAWARLCNYLSPSFCGKKRVYSIYKATEHVINKYIYIHIYTYIYTYVYIYMWKQYPQTESSDFFHLARSTDLSCRAASAETCRHAGSRTKWSEALWCEPR